MCIFDFVHVHRIHIYIHIYTMQLLYCMRDRCKLHDTQLTISIANCNACYMHGASLHEGLISSIAIDLLFRKSAYMRDHATIKGLGRCMAARTSTQLDN